MKLSELRYGEHFTCRFEPYSDKTKKLVDPSYPLGVILNKQTSYDDAYIVKIGANAEMVRLIDCSDTAAFENRILAGQTNLYEVTASLSKDNQIDVEVVFFREYKEFTGPFIVNVSKEFQNPENPLSAKKTGFSSKKDEELCKILRSQFTLGSSNSPYFLYMGNGVDAYTIVNKEYQLELKSGRKNGETELFATGLRRHKPRNTEKAVCLAKGKLSFNYLSPEKISMLNAKELERNLQEGDSYIGEWDQYNSEIGKRLLESARKVGYAVVRGEPERVGIHELLFHTVFTENDNVHGDFSSLAENDCVDIVQELPDYLQNPEMTYEQWIDGIDKELEKENITVKKNKKEEKKEREEKEWSNQSVTDISDDTITISTNNKGLPVREKDGKLYLVLSIVGEKTQVVRRRRARKLIMKGESEISNLGLILDGKENLTSNIPVISGKKKKISEKQQEKIYKKIFKYDPTDNQKSAINMAQVTPDIAVIQGPPGTGKTTVICGIIESLNESFQKDNNIAGKIFVTSLQHDAVENIRKRLSINALPTVKFGRSSGEDEYSLSATQERIQKWCEETAEAIVARTPSLVESAELESLRSLFMDYKKSPSISMELTLLNGIKNLSPRFTTPAILEKIDSIIQSIDDKEQKENEAILSYLYALRTDEQSFLDDGKQRAMELYVLLKEEQISIPPCLAKACSYSEGESLEFLSELKKYKDHLLEEYIPHTEFRKAKENLVITNLVKEVSDRIQQYPFDPSEKKNMALADFVYELQNNPDGITNTLLNYNPVLAATVQQGEGKEMKEARERLGLDGLFKSTPYEYVIVDEAARVAPPDLLIPMSKAKHIILVGDHRQLPQQIDQEIEKKMEEAAASKEDIAFLNESTFERLFMQLDITKKITLNKQFRMHPVLGQFISKEFYEAHNKEEAFESPLGPENFVQNLSFISKKSAVWYDVKNDAGNGAECKNKLKSRFRKGEAIAAAKLLAKWLEDDSERKLTFGIISFYSAQCLEIKKQLKNYGVFDEKLQIKDEYKYTAPDKNGDIEERIKIGTVDAFQGMEFDVVILCAVRTAKNERINSAYNELHRNAEEGLKKQQSIFGFLMSKNRLCVSMSRQKKSLVVIGDKNLFSSPLAQESVPELYDYYKLCNENKAFGLVLEDA